MKPVAKAGAIQAAHQELRPSVHGAGSGAETDGRVRTITALGCYYLPGTVFAWHMCWLTWLVCTAAQDNNIDDTDVIVISSGQRMKLRPRKAK